MRQRWRESMGEGVGERVDEVSAELPYELQSRMFDQLAAVGIGGAGLAVTPIGSLLKTAPRIVWLEHLLRWQARGGVGTFSPDAVGTKTGDGK